MTSNGAGDRELLHIRSIEAKGYRRADGRFDIEVHLRDTKTYDRVNPAGTRPAGMPIHDMALCLTLDRMMTIVDAQAVFDSVPYHGTCDSISKVYRRLVGMRLAPGFSTEVRHCLGGTLGCTHMTDLISIAATTAFQTIGKSVGTGPGNQRPFQLDRCHALKVSGPVVARYYPQWSMSGAEKRGAGRSNDESG
jgi:hypothetical protein